MTALENQKISVAIAAAGKGTRSNLPYPKCLYKVKDREILGRILDVLPKNIHSLNIIVSDQGYDPIASYLNNINFKSFNLIPQRVQLGMGNAILQLRQAKSIAEDILLLWGDLPFISSKSIENLINHHFNEDNDFSFLTLKTTSCYTIVERDDLQKIRRVIETRELKPSKSFLSSGERDIGVFLFKKEIILDYLARDLANKFGLKSGEHGFLYVIEHLVNDGFRVSGLETKNKIEGVSFNSLEDIKEFL